MQSRIYKTQSQELKMTKKTHTNEYRNIAALWTTQIGTAQVYLHVYFLK